METLITYKPNTSSTYTTTQTYDDNGYLISAAIVDVFPHPVGPVSKINPCRRSINCPRNAGKCSDSSVGICPGKSRMLAASVPR